MINDNTLNRSIYRARVSRAGLKPHIGVENLRKQKLKYVKNTLFDIIDKGPNISVLSCSTDINIPYYFLIQKKN